MAERSFDEKTEKATPKKRADVRKKGEVAKSRELPSVAVLLAGLMILSILGTYFFNSIQISMKESFAHFTLREFGTAEFMVFAEKMVKHLILTVLPLLGVIFVTAIFSNIAQVGFLLSAETIKPKLSKLDPIKGFGRLFSRQSFLEVFKSLLKLSIVGAIAYFTVKGEMETVPLLGGMELGAIVIYILKTILKIAFRCVFAMIFLVAIDYAYQRWEFEKKIRMSKKEVKDEFKRTEGDPLVKSRIRSIQMEMARKRMMQEVPKADVVITNPTHIAVALKYDSMMMGAPKVLAKGAGAIAERIKKLARENEIPIVEDKGLARSLHALVEIGKEVPSELYQAVAEVLAYVYKLKRNHAS